MHFKCPICDSESFDDSLPYKGNSEIFLDRSIVRCRVCHTFMIHPFPTEEELNIYYQSYWIRKKIEHKFPVYRAQAEARFMFMRPYMPGDNILSIFDVGAGFGLLKIPFIENINASSIFYDAVEIDPTAVDYLKNNIEPRAIYSRLEDSNGKYHIIILSHILEHVTDPLRFLQHQSKRLIKDGMIFIEVPNEDHRFKLQNEPHLYFFNESTLSYLVDIAGYQVLNVSACGERILLKNTPVSPFINIKALVRSALPAPILKIIHSIRKTKRPESSFKSLFEYGPNRRWIRLVARVTSIEE